MTKKGKITPFDVVKHPIDTFETLKYDDNGSIWMGIVVLCVYFFSDILCKTAKGFLFSTGNIEHFNIMDSFNGTVVIMVLFVIANWCLTTLSDGEGSIKKIFVVTSYSVLPIAFYNFLDVIFSQFLLPSEYFFMNYVKYILQGLFVLYLAVGLKFIHDYKVKRTIIVLIGTVVGMLIIVFLIALFIQMTQQLFGFFNLLYSEYLLRR